MNSIEKQECINMLGTYNDKTMEDYFDMLNYMSGLDIDSLKTDFKKHYSNETNWSF